MTAASARGGKAAEEGKKTGGQRRRSFAGLPGRRRRGETLLLVLTFFLVLTVLGTAALTAAAVSAKAAGRRAGQERADLVAQSAAKAAESYILQQLNAGALLRYLQSNAGTPVQVTVGLKNVEVDTVSVLYEESGAVKITARYTDPATGAVGSAACYLAKSESTGPAFASNYLVYSSTAAAPFVSDTGNFGADGGIDVQGGSNVGTYVANGDVNLSGANGSCTYGDSAAYGGKAIIAATGNVTDMGNRVYGDIFAGGEVLLSESAAKLRGSICAGGDIRLTGGAAMAGSAYTNGAFVSDAGGRDAVDGDVHADGDVTILNGSARAVYAGGNLTLGGGSASLDGTSYANGKFTVQDAASVHGDAYAAGAFSLDGTVDGSVHTNGAFAIGGGTGSVVTGNIYAAGDVFIGSGTVDGAIYAGGTCTVDPGGGAVVKGQIHAQSAAPAGLANFVPTQHAVSAFASPVMPLPSYAVTYVPPVLNAVGMPAEGMDAPFPAGGTVTSSCSLADFDPGRYQNRTITVDTTVNHRDINLYVPEDADTAGWGWPGITILYKTADTAEAPGRTEYHNIYVWLGAGATLALQAFHIAPASSGDKSNFYFVQGVQADGRNDPVTLSLARASVVGHVYLPNGTFRIADCSDYAGGRTYPNLLGNVSCRWFRSVSQNRLVYEAPDAEDDTEKIFTTAHITDGKLRITGPDGLYAGGADFGGIYAESGWARQ